MVAPSTPHVPCVSCVLSCQEPNAKRRKDDTHESQEQRQVQLVEGQNWWCFNRCHLWLMKSCMSCMWWCVHIYILIYVQHCLARCTVKKILCRGWNCDRGFTNRWESCDYVSSKPCKSLHVFAIIRKLKREIYRPAWGENSRWNSSRECAEYLAATNWWCFPRLVDGWCHGLRDFSLTWLGDRVNVDLLFVGWMTSGTEVKSGSYVLWKMKRLIVLQIEIM